jgi:hypothetical protein
MTDLLWYRSVSEPKSCSKKKTETCNLNPFQIGHREQINLYPNHRIWSENTRCMQQKKHICINLEIWANIFSKIHRFMKHIATTLHQLIWIQQSQIYTTKNKPSSTLCGILTARTTTPAVAKN